jgi:tRNA-dihydrouridine synthase 3
MVCADVGLMTVCRLSHLYRYVPVGLLEHGYTQAINHRPPAYVGRDELETLMSSPNVKDWIKISEMLLGPCAPDFVFLPKHKSNSWE